MEPVTRGERTWDSAPELLYLAVECGHTLWVSEDVRDTGMDSVECELDGCGWFEGDRRTWKQLYIKSESMRSERDGTE